LAARWPASARKQASCWSSRARTAPARPSFHGSTIVYQGALRGLGEKEVARVSAFATAGLPDPDLVLVLDILPETARSRIEERGESGDRIENAAIERLELLTESYGRLPGEHISGEGDPAEVLARALEVISHKLS
jgi:thymidylate kinase